ncbi:MAG: pantoate--beta-alanine ligase [Bryobacterales bacterium]|nr:pantoate--beta-alanine ligase [Bryobacterales bacterium]MDE0621928.1 pantoate--beta-alanine ligase [Bryobacterales bacterium]
MATERIERIARIRERVAAAKRRGLRVGCVPTMGALHAAHTAMFDRARGECDLVVATIFVNPLQFDRQDDLRSYPRDTESDLIACERHGVDLVFVPDVAEMYPRPPAMTVEIEGLADGLCGASRPGHFRGVATVVLKLLNSVQPDIAYFGEKDYQQLAIVRRLAEDACLPVEIASVETVREPDGLALSSRNVLLSRAERASAPAIFRALRRARNAVESGQQDAGKVVALARQILDEEPLLRVDYFEIVDPDTLEPVRSIHGPVRIIAAAFFGSTRLIDNIRADPVKAR